MTYKSKYLKYKLKYLNLKKQLYGGAAPSTPPLANPDLPPRTIVSNNNILQVVSNKIKDNYNDMFHLFNHIKDALSLDDLWCIFRECEKDNPNETIIEDVLHQHIPDSSSESEDMDVDAADNMDVDAADEM
tara:strand:+ start:1840 stop:2232 length:393 start_codon:yes stop_codon:yes gene_type:complete